MRDTRIDARSTPVRSSARFLVRHPRSSTTAATVSGAVLWAGYAAVLWAAGIAVLVGVSWRLLDQPTFDRFAGRLLRAWFRRWAIYQRQWWRVLTACQLSTTDHHGNQLMPKLTRVRSTWVWDTLHIRLAKGQAPDDFGPALDRLANSFRARASTMRILGPAKIALDLQRREPFDEMLIGLPSMPESAEAVNLSKLPLGKDEYARDWGLDLIKGVHVLLAGVTGSGKGSFLWGLMRAVAPMIRDGSVRLWVLDPKGGMEFGSGREIFHRFATDDASSLRVLREYVAELDSRKDQLGRRGVRTATPSTETPLDILVCDELAAMTSYADRKVQTEFSTLLSKALTQFRAVGGRVVGATQEPTKENIPMRGLFPTKIALRVDSASQVDMCLGDGARDLGAFADKLPEILPGVAYVKQEGRREPLRVRAAYTTDDDIAELVEYCTTRPATVTTLTPTGDADQAAEHPEAGDPIEVDFVALEDDSYDEIDTEEEPAGDAEVEEIDYFEGDDEDEETA